MLNRKIEIKLVKDTKSANDADPIIAAPIDYNAIAKEAVKRLVIGTCIVIGTTVALTTVSKIVVKHI